MDTNANKNEVTEVHAAISRVALSLDSFLMNGIPYGVIPRAGLDGFLEHVAGILQRDLANLEAQVTHAPAASQFKINDVLARLRVRCQQLIDLLTGLRAFHTFLPDHLHVTLSRIPLLRAECAKLIQELEGHLSIPKSFYQCRPAHSTAQVTDFLANLEQLFAEALVPSTAET